MAEITFDDFMKVDIRVGIVTEAEPIQRRVSLQSSCGSILAMRSV